MKKYRNISLIKKEVLFLIIIIILAVSLRLWKIFELPINGDEGFQGRIVLEMKKSGNVIINAGVPWQGPMVLYIIASGIYLFGNNTLALRIPILFLSLFTMILFYIYVKRLYGIEIGFLSLFVFIIIPALIMLDITAIEYSPMLFFILLSIHLFYKYKKTNSDKFIYLFSFVSGIGIMTRLSFLFFIFSFLLTLKINPDNKTKKRRNNSKIKKLLVCFLFLVIGVYPMIHYNIFNDFPTIRYALGNFPKTQFNSDLTNVGINLFKGFKMFSIFFAYRNPFILGIFLCSLLIFIYTIFSKKSDNIIKRKNIFIILNLIILFVLISTLTLTIFKIEEFIILSPFYSIIIGWSLFTTIKKLIPKYQFYVFFIFVFLVLIFFIKNVEMYEYALSLENYGCIDYGTSLSAVVNKMNCTIVVTDTNFLRDFLWWHLSDKDFIHLSYENGPTDADIETLSTSFKEGSCYIFTLEKCKVISYENQYPKVNQTFFNFIGKYNKTIINEELFSSKEGENLFKIYKIV